ncbi:MAG: response regulator [Oscillospiraceae bacterium]|nr:response regulator [Oscillospiraceae bacterium]
MRADTGAAILERGVTILKVIFTVDDSSLNLMMVEEALEPHFTVMTMLSGHKLFLLLKKMIPDLILLDIEMPDMDGFEVLRQLKAHERYAEIPVVFLTAWSDAATEVKGFEMGAADFIHKPFSAPVLLKRVKSHLHVDTLIRERTCQLERLRNGIISVLADMVESRDVTTGGHIERTATYIRILIDALLECGLHADEINAWDLETVAASARLHDVGKIAVSDLVLNKPGRLTAEEFEKVKVHTTEGERIIDQMVHQTGEESFLNHARLFAGYHHERWDGAGYPYRLKGGDIPLHGRIMAVADAYDAIISERPYKPAFPPEEAERIIMADAGKHFDPDIAGVFFAAREKFRAVM